MEHERPRTIDSVPEKEANELTKRLRHHPDLAGCGISVYAYVNKSGTRALHVAVDFPKGERYDLRYKAETDIKLLERNAVKRIKSHWLGSS